MYWCELRSNDHNAKFKLFKVNKQRNKIRMLICIFMFFYLFALFAISMFCVVRIQTDYRHK